MSEATADAGRLAESVKALASKFELWHDLAVTGTAHPMAANLRLDVNHAQWPTAEEAAKVLRRYQQAKAAAEGQEIMKEYKGMPALDAGLLAAAQAVEHYEIARYGTLKTWACDLGLDRAAELLDATLAEEKMTNKALTQLAANGVNQHAEADE